MARLASGPRTTPARGSVPQRNPGHLPLCRPRRPSGPAAFAMTISPPLLHRRRLRPVTSRALPLATLLIALPLGRPASAQTAASDVQAAAEGNQSGASEASDAPTVSAG